MFKTKPELWKGESDFLDLLADAHFFELTA